MRRRGRKEVRYRDIYRLAEDCCIRRVAETSRGSYGIIETHDQAL